MNLVRCLSCIFLCMAILPAMAEDAAEIVWSPYDVTAYGAKGDGITDDTDAIQRCIMAAEQDSYPYFKAESGYNEVIFPAGKYRVSKTLVIGAAKQPANLSVRGEGEVVIHQEHADRDILYMHHGYRQSVENITFEGGRTHIRYFSNNMNRAQLLIRNCRFVDASSYAVDDSLKGVHHSRIVPPYEVQWENSLPHLAEVDVDDLPDVFFTSSILHIDNSGFVNCMNVVRAFADWGIISNCRITTSPDMQGAAIYSRGVLKIKDTTCMAYVREGRQQRLVDNINAGVILQNVTLDTDGIGLCPIYNRRVYDNGGLYNIYTVIDNCQLKAAGSSENSFIYCEEVPNLAIVTNSTETSGTTIPALAFRQPVTKEYLQHVSFPEMVQRLPELAQIYGYMVSMPRTYDISEAKFQHNFTFSFDGNENLDCELPPVLEQFMETPFPSSVRQGFAMPESSGEAVQSDNGESVNVYEYGARGDGQHDDTLAIQRAVDAAGKAGAAEVLFPGGIYNISGPIELTDDLTIRGLGLACIRSIDGNRTLVTGENVRAVTFANIGFYKAENAVRLTTDPLVRARIRFEHCFFSDIDGIAVSCLAGEGRVGEANLTEVRVTDCVFGLSGKAVLTNAANAVFDCNWLSLHETPTHGSFENRGTMRIIDCIGVPSVNGPAVWVDNRHKIVIDNMRFGGEGKYTKNLVENNSSSGEISINYSWLCCDDGTVLVCNEVPAIAALYANFGPPDAQLQTMVAMERTTDSEHPAFLFEQCNIVPTNFKHLPAANASQELDEQ